MFHPTLLTCFVHGSCQVYDVSMFAQQHPGGSVIYTHAGRDATDIFAGFHAPATWKLLQQFYIGDYMVSSSNFLWQFKNYFTRTCTKYHPYGFPKADKAPTKLINPLEIGFAF